MPVDTPHPDYAYRKTDWAKIRAFAEGSRSVKSAGEAYLPKITGQTPEEYNAFKSRAEVYGALDRTIDGLVGAVFLKSPTITLPSGADEEFTKDVTLAGNTITEFLRQIVGEIVTVARGGVLIDYSGGAVPASDAAGADSRPAAMAGADRPYLVTYVAEQIINWETQIIDGKTMLTMVDLEETGWTSASNDPFAKVIAKSYRVLRLVNGIYTVEKWTPKVQTTSAPVTGTNSMGTGATTEYEKTGEWVPTRRGEPLREIPFFFIGSSGESISPEKPPLLDVAELCHLHYMVSADYAHGLHWVGLPTPWATGVGEKDKLAIGPTTAILINDPNAKVGMLEFTGTGLTAVEKRLDGLERKMAILGARILEENKAAAETAEAMKIRQGGDASVLAGISDAVSRRAEAILARMLWWAGTDANEPDVTVELNMDFMLVRLGYQDLLAILQAWQAGGITKETFLYNLKRGQILSEETTVEEELAKLEVEPPPGMANPANPAKGVKGGA